MSSATTASVGTASVITALADQDLVSMLGTVFGRQAAANARAGDFDREFWDTLASLGLTRLTQPESHGGSGADWPEAAALLAAAARHAVPVPVVEHDLLAGWLLEAAGLEAPPSRLYSATILDSGGRAQGVGWAAPAETLAVLWPFGDQWHAATVPAGDVPLADTALPAGSVRVTADGGQPGEPRGTVAVVVAALPPHPVPAWLARHFRLRGALARTIQVAAAMEAVVDLCARHAGERTQFGRPLAKFQAVRDLVAGAAAQSALASAATASAVAAVSGEPAGLDGAAGSGQWSDAAELAVAVARSTTGHAATAVIRNAHQVHGAIGTTAEHQLHRYTGPIGLWRTEFGSVRSWDDYLARAAVAAGGDGLWPLLTRGSSL
jgi:acyl-CoA dehydrogenase